VKRYREFDISARAWLLSLSEDKNPPLLDPDRGVSASDFLKEAFMMHVRSGLISRLLKASIFIGTTMVVALIVHNLMLPYADIAASFANVTASVSDKFGLDLASTNRRPPASPSTTSAERLAQIDEQSVQPDKLAVSDSTDPTASNNRPGSDVLFSRFKEWAAAQPNAAPAQPGQALPFTQSAPAQSTERTQSVTPPSMQKRRQVHPVIVRNERPDTPMRHLGKQVQPVQNARAQVAPAQTAPAQR
jgi:hypothetical protein